MVLAHGDSFLVSWMDSASEHGNTKWGPMITSHFLQSCSLVTASDRLEPLCYEDLDLSSELDDLFLGTLSCENLEKLVLSIPRLSSFHTLNDLRLLPAVMGLIEKYTRSNSLFEHYYGLLCVQLLAHVLDVGLLIHMDSLDQYRNGSANGLSLAWYLHRNLVERAIKKKKAHDFAEFFGGIQAIRRGRLLHTIGGISMRSLELLFQLMWRDRKLFLAVAIHMGPGRQWSSIFFVLSLYCFIKGDKKLMSQMMELTYRYSCIATEDDRFFIWISSVFFIEVPRGEFSANKPMDGQDSGLLVNLFTREIHPRVQGNGVNILLGMAPPFVEFGVSILTQETDYLAGFCAVGIFARIWWEIEEKKRRPIRNIQSIAAFQLRLPVCL
ncbi:hypothetical protein BDV93DRAFT_339621 [Ceratobasidium sp. AG-I]|nr:hypothetical protein BDV93DRAFT_339621 [Ceratobasidium sp. AG-I]